MWAYDVLLLDQLQLQSEIEISHPADRSLKIMPFSDKQFHSKKKARLRVGNTALSDAFPIDTAGDAGRITCRDSTGFDYELTIDVQLCQSGLTKVLTFTAFYLLQNSSKFDIEVNEYTKDGTANWMSIPAETVSGCLAMLRNETIQFLHCSAYACGRLRTQRESLCVHDTRARQTSRYCSLSLKPSKSSVRQKAM